MLGSKNCPAAFRLRLTALALATLLLSAGCTVRDAPRAAPAAGTTSLQDLVEVMGQRLAVMPQVAEWKRANDKPVRDRPRELVVLDEAVKAVDAAARKAGVTPLPKDAVRRFYQAQIDTAVGIQEQILSRPPKLHAKAPNLDTVIRPKLDRLGTRIADLLVVQPGPPDRSYLKRLARKHWKVEGLESAAVTRLVNALERLLAPSGERSTPEVDPQNCSPLRVDPFPPSDDRTRLSEGTDVTQYDTRRWKDKWWEDEKWKNVDRLEARFKDNDLGYWNDSKAIHAFGLMYQATCDSEYLAHWKSFNDVLLMYRSDKQIPQRVDTRRGVVAPAWTYFDEGHAHAEIAINGIYGHSLAWFARVVAENPTLHEQYGSTAVEYTNAVMEVIDFFGVEDARWSIEGYQDSLYYYSVTRRKPAPFNIVHLLGLAMIEVHRTLRSPYYAEHARRAHALADAQIARIPFHLTGLARRFMFKDDLRMQQVGTADKTEDKTHYLWWYEEETEASPMDVEDASHGAITAHFLSLLYRDRRALYQHLPVGWEIPLGVEDMGRFARTFVLKMTPDADTFPEAGPSISYFIDGTPREGYDVHYMSGECQGWLELARFDPRLYARCERILLQQEIEGNPPHLRPHNHAALLRHKSRRYVNLQMSDGGETAWRPLHQTEARVQDLRVGDFDGDGSMDLFRRLQGQWAVSGGGDGHWRRVNSSDVALSDLRFGDFDGDGTTDVFRVKKALVDGQADIWSLSWSSTGSWSSAGGSREDPSNLRFGDFNGDGCTDIFRTVAGEWQVAFGSPSRSFSFWTPIGSAAAPLVDLRFGDFDGDGTTDLFRLRDGIWEISFGELSSSGTYVEHGFWTEVGWSDAPPGELRFGDFNGDGITDVLRVRVDRWDVSFGSSEGEMEPWVELNDFAPAGEKPRDLLIGDFTGDGIDDIVRETPTP